jgi:hypothetical protein
MKRFWNQRSKLILLAILLLALISVLYFQNAPKRELTRAEIAADLKNASKKKGIAVRCVVHGPEDANSLYAFKVFPGALRIERDLSAVSFSGTSPTALDGLDCEQLTAFRREKVEKYRQLGFFHPGYSPFSPPHARIYGQITPGADWLYSVPYYIANPYLLVILVPANHVTPIDIYLPQVDIQYRNGILSETIRGASARKWFKALYSSDHAGFVRFVMVNAWDAGFCYIYLDPFRSCNIKPSENLNNVTRSWHSQSCVFHVGKYGKNNLSPEDGRAWVELLKRDEPTRLHVKLWRAKPTTVDDPADLIFIFDIDPQKI